MRRCSSARSGEPSDAIRELADATMQFRVVSQLGDATMTFRMVSEPTSQTAWPTSTVSWGKPNCRR